MKKIFLIRHSGPFLDLNYENNITFEEQSITMILNEIGLNNAEKLSNLVILNGIKNIYSANSTRSIQTINFLAKNNKTKIKVDNLLNERKFGVKFIEELPKDFIIQQFQDKDYKLHCGESLNDVKKRLQDFYMKISDLNEVIIGIHGIALFAFIDIFCDTHYDGKTFKIVHNDKIIYDDIIKNPDVFELDIVDNNLVNLINHSIL